MINHYKTLGVDEKATLEVITKAYRQLALKIHPDKNGGDRAKEEQFKQVGNAYAVLKDAEKRKQHDAQLAAERRASSKPVPQQERRTQNKSSLFSNPPSYTRRRQSSDERTKFLLLLLKLKQARIEQELLVQLLLTRLIIQQYQLRQLQLHAQQMNRYQKASHAFDRVSQEQAPARFRR